jgi:hypothetical protein
MCRYFHNRPLVTAASHLAPDYVEKELNTNARSYPSAGGDAMAYASSGFLWQNRGRGLALYYNDETRIGREQFTAREDARPP